MENCQRGCDIVACEGEGLLVAFDTSVYRLTAIKKAAHKFGDRFHLLIRPTSDGRVEVVLKAKTTLADPKRVVGEFCNEVLDQDLRELVAQETQAVRDLILAHAFSRTPLLSTETEEADYHSDPLGILKCADRLKDPV
jgi:His-Xaa-Ser system protein HxsD